MTDPEVQLPQLAQLVRLELTPEEADELAQEFSAILQFVSSLQAAEVEGIPVTNQVTDLENIYRADDVVASIHHRTLVELAPNREGDLVRAPGVFLVENGHDD